MSFLTDVMQDEELADIIEDCETYAELRDTLKEESEHVFLETLAGKCGECVMKEEEIEDLEEEVSSLNDDNKELQTEHINEIAEMELEFNKSLYPETIDDIYKIEAFKKIKDNFTVSEIEEMLNKHKS